MSQDGENRKMSLHSLEMIQGEGRQRKSSLKSGKSLLYQPTRTHRLSVNFDPDPIVLPTLVRESSLNDEKNEDVNNCKSSGDTSSQNEDEVDLATIGDLNKKFLEVKIDGSVKIGKTKNSSS